MATIGIRRGVVLGLLAVAVLAVAILVARSNPLATAQTGDLGYRYAAKFVCGTISGGEGPLADGEYATAVNVHNLQDFDVQVLKRAVLAPVEPQVGTPGEFQQLEVPPDAAFEIDCPDILTLLKDASPPAFVKGFVLVDSLSELDVWSVYTSTEKQNSATAGTGVSEDIEVVAANSQPLPCDPTGPNFDDDAPPIGIGGGIGSYEFNVGDLKSYPIADASVPNADAISDSCDPDDDNDGLLDAAPDSDPRGDITYDDDQDGNPACLGNGDGTCDLAAGEVMCLGGTDDDGSDDGPSWDTDCTAARDGVEGSCPLAANPNGDDDADGLKNTWEVCKWGTDINKTDTDGDGLGDCTEAADNDGNGEVKFGLDALNSARAASLPPGRGVGQFGKDGTFDLDGDNDIKFGLDTLFIARASFGLDTDIFTAGDQFCQ